MYQKEEADLKKSSRFSSYARKGDECCVNIDKKID